MIMIISNYRNFKTIQHVIISIKPSNTIKSNLNFHPLNNKTSTPTVQLINPKNIQYSLTSAMPEDGAFAPVIPASDNAIWPILLSNKCPWATNRGWPTPLSVYFLPNEKRGKRIVRAAPDPRAKITNIFPQIQVKKLKRFQTAVS